jgi:hypothetical protein
MAPATIWAALERTALATAVREGTWLYPAIETLHVLALATLFGGIALLDARLLGAAPSLPLDALARHVLRPVRAAFAVLVATGALMFSADAAALVENPAFRLKMVLVPLAVANALVFEAGGLRRLRADPRAPVPRAARAFAAASLALWAAVIVCGRLIAYL